MKKVTINKTIFIFTVLLFIGYSIVQYSAIAFSYNGMVSFPDFLISMLNQPFFLSNPLLLLYILFGRNFIKLYDRFMLENIINAVLYCFSIFLSIVIAFVFKQGTESINLNWSKFGFFAGGLDPLFAIMMTFLFIVLRLIAFSLSISFIDKLTKNDWSGSVVIYFVSLCDTFARAITNSSSLIGIFPSEHTSVYYNFYWGISHIPRISFLASFIYWFIIIYLLYYANKRVQVNSLKIGGGQ